MESTTTPPTTTAPGPAPTGVACSPSNADVSWMLVATVLVLGMLPGLSFFEAGLLRSKNTISITVQVFSGTAVLCSLWILIGYSLSFSGELIPGAGLLGGFDNVGLRAVRYDDCYPGTTIPTALYSLFQMMFAAITPLLMTGAFAERLAWWPFIILMVAWEVIVYYPVAHWMWSPHGWLNKLGAQDFAGGIVIHITAGVSSLVSVMILGRRHDFHRHHGEAPYSSLPIACIGASLLWTGWFGFNGGSALMAGGLAVHAVMNSQIAASICSCCFLLITLYRTRRPSIVAIINGAIAGLAGITPCAGYVSLGWGILLAVVLAITAHISMFFVKHKFKIDDALDVSCVHGVPGLVGALWTGFFGNVEVGGELNGVFSNGGGHLLGAQVLACIVCGAWAGFWTFAILKITARFIPLRVSIASEIGGLDLHEHNEVAWLAEKVSPNTSFAIVPLHHPCRPRSIAGGDDGHGHGHALLAHQQGHTGGGGGGLSQRSFVAGSGASHLQHRESLADIDINELIRSRAVVVVEAAGTPTSPMPQDDEAAFTEVPAADAAAGGSAAGGQSRSSTRQSRGTVRSVLMRVDADNGGYGTGM